MDEGLGVGAEGRIELTKLWELTHLTKLWIRRGFEQESNVM